MTYEISNNKQPLFKYDQTYDVCIGFERTQKIKGSLSKDGKLARRENFDICDSKAMQKLMPHLTSNSKLVILGHALKKGSFLYGKSAKGEVIKVSPKFIANSIAKFAPQLICEKEEVLTSVSSCYPICPSERRLKISYVGCWGMLSALNLSQELDKQKIPHLITARDGFVILYTDGSKRVHKNMKATPRHHVAGDKFSISTKDNLTIIRVVDYSGKEEVGFTLTNGFFLSLCPLSRMSSVEDFTHLLRGIEALKIDNIEFLISAALTGGVSVEILRFLLGQGIKLPKNVLYTALSSKCSFSHIHFLIDKGAKIIEDWDILLMALTYQASMETINLLLDKIKTPILQQHFDCAKLFYRGSPLAQGNRMKILLDSV